MGWSFLHVMGWATYLGGALVMELVWRPAQDHMPASQIAEACRWMGRRYRWVAATALGATGISGAGLVAGDGRPLDLATPYGRTVAALALMWLAMVASLAAITFLGHPGLHVRMPADLSEPEREAAREEVRRAITRMDRLLRVDLLLAIVATLLGASLSSGTG